MCLMIIFNVQKADKYTIIVEAKDHGEGKQLSSSCTVIVHIEDGNNHIPVITGQTVRHYFFHKEGNKITNVSHFVIKYECVQGVRESERRRGKCSR